MYLKQRKFLRMISLFYSIAFLALLGFLFNCKANPNSKQTPILQEGILNLNEQNNASTIFNETGLIQLDGYWEFYWKEFKNPDEIKNYTQPKSFIKVPSSWNDFVYEGKKVGGYGYATYAANLILPPEWVGKILTLKIPHMGTAYRLYVNEELLSENGKIAETKEEMKPQYLNRTKSFIMKDKSILLTIQVSNFHHRKGGMRFDSVYLGLEEKIQSLQTNNTMYIFFLMGSLAIMAIYHFGLFFLRKEDIAALVFGIFCILISIRLCFVGDVWITSIYPNLDWAWMYRIEYISLYLSAPIFSIFTYFVFKEEFNRKILIVSTFVYTLFVVMVLFTQPNIFSLSLNLFQALASINTGYIVFVIAKAIYKKREGSFAAMVGFLFFTLTIINDLLYNNEIILTGNGNLIPFGVFLFIFSQSFILSQIFSNAFKSVNILSSDLSKTNEAYSRFVPVQFLNYLNKNSIVDIQLGDQVQKDMAILFSDIRSFTELSEKLTPKENFNFLNSYLQRMSPVIQKNNGFIDKYIGDAIMALFPGEVEDAIHAAIDMQKEIRVYNQQRLKIGYDPIKIGCGIHSGNLMLGIIGADARMEGTVIADSVNVASRIEGLTKVYDASILISDIILKKINNPSNFNYRFIDRVKVKGKSDYTVIYEIYDGQPNFMIELKTQTKKFFEDAITLYYDKQFKESISAFQKVIEINPNDTATLIYLKRAKYYLENQITEFLE